MPDPLIPGLLCRWPRARPRKEKKHVRPTNPSAARLPSRAWYHRAQLNLPRVPGTLACCPASFACLANIVMDPGEYCDGNGRRKGRGNGDLSTVAVKNPRVLNVGIELTELNPAKLVDGEPSAVVGSVVKSTPVVGFGSHPKNLGFEIAITVNPRVFYWSNDLKNAWGLYMRMKDAGCLPNTQSCIFLIRLCKKQETVDMALMELWNDMEEKDSWVWVLT
ncbi:hypothetical protein Droror1_Dr00017693 [Drosera rotundifolia]